VSFAPAGNTTLFTLLLGLAVCSSCGFSGTLRIWYVVRLGPAVTVRVRQGPPE
jgi:hypothetical protein